MLFIITGSEPVSNAKLALGSPRIRERRVAVALRYGSDKDREESGNGNQQGVLRGGLESEALMAEAEQAALEALTGFLKEKGLEAEAAQILETAVEKVAKTHGFMSEPAGKLDLDELDAVAGGVCGCPFVGGGTGTGKQCACVMGGGGHNDSGAECVCCLGGGGRND